MERYRVIVADDHPVFRDGLARVLRGAPELEVVGVAADGPAALDRIRELAPDVAMVDLRLPALTGIEVARAAADEALATRILIISGYDDAATVYAALEAGAVGFVTKDAAPRDLVDAVLRAARGGTTLGPGLAEALAGQIRARADQPEALLTEREHEVLRLLADGLSAPAIASRLYLGTSTVKTHLGNLYAKLGVNDRAAAVAEGMRRGLLR